MVKTLILNNWLTKIGTLIVAIAIWYLVKSSDTSGIQVIPVPGEKLPEKGSIPILPSAPDSTGNILTSPISGADTTTPVP